MGRPRKVTGEAVKRVFTTGDVAMMFGVTRITVNRWVDIGKIKGFNLPDSNDRRIPIESLYEFAEANHIPKSLLFSYEAGARSKLGYHRRASERKELRTEAVVRLVLPDGTEFDRGTAVVENINGTGAFIKNLRLGRAAFPAGTFNCEIELGAGPLKGLTLKSILVRCAATDTGVGWGLRFVDPAPAAETRLREFLEGGKK